MADLDMDEAALEAMFAKKTKKKKAPKAEAIPEGAAEAGAAAGGSAPGADGVDPDDTYEDMLSRVFSLLHENNPELLGRERKKLKPPQVSRVGTTRTAWTNFKEICQGMKRSPDHVLAFFLAELGTTGAIDGADRLVLKGRYMLKGVESLLRKYVRTYVSCMMCHSVNTELTRDPLSRLYFMNCKACGSSRSVAQIKAGYHATAKGERKKARQAAGM